VIVRPLDDPDNKIVRHARRLMRSRTARDKTHQFVLEGPHLALEAIRAQARLRAVLYSGRLMDRPDGEAVLKEMTGGHVRTVFVSDRILDLVADVDTHQGVIAIAELALPEVRHLPLEDWILADGIQDPGNLGTIIRSAAAFGFRIGLLPGTVDAFNPKVVRATAGTLFRAGLTRVGWPVEWPHGLQVLVADPRDAVPFVEIDWRRPTCLIVGNEGSGVDPVLAERAAGRVGIPMEPGVDSLNAAMATAILLAHAYVTRFRR
jgi:TrmH family RNA methyltransferase